jgi:hypothetical protein
VELEAQRALLDQRYEQLRADMEKLQVQKQAAINAENYAAAEQIKSVSCLCFAGTHDWPKLCQNGMIRLVCSHSFWLFFCVWLSLVL